jgi:hypothetical protein
MRFCPPGDVTRQTIDVRCPSAKGGPSGNSGFAAAETELARSGGGEPGSLKIKGFNSYERFKLWRSASRNPGDHVAPKFRSAVGIRWMASLWNILATI